MRARQWLALGALLGCVAAHATEAPRDTTVAAPPTDPVSTKPAPAPPPSAKPVPDADVAPPPKPAAADSKPSDGPFKPSEQISEDMAVAYPVDI
jgi:hypothetical protein